MAAKRKLLLASISLRSKLSKFVNSNLLWVCFPLCGFVVAVSGFRLKKKGDFCWILLEVGRVNEKEL